MKHLSFAALALCARARWTVAFSAVPTAPAVRELAVAREVLELGTTRFPALASRALQKEDKSSAHTVCQN